MAHKPRARIIPANKQRDSRDEGEVRCPECGDILYPPSYRCPECNTSYEVTADDKRRMREGI